MRACSLILAFVFLLGACKEILSSDENDVIAKVQGRVLHRYEVREAILAGVSSEDSLLIAESYIDKWVKDALVYYVALPNLESEKRDINKLVESYRHSLVKHRFQEKLVQERLVANIGESDKRSFYEENKKMFVLDKTLIRGLFLKIPIDAPGLADVKKWYRSNAVESLEKIEKYSVQNASVYDYFYDRWVDFDEVRSNFPVGRLNANVFFNTNKFVEVSDSSFCYLLNIQDYVLRGNIAPYEYAESRILNILTSQRKREFLKDFENELYIDAVRSGDVKFFTEP
jgi:hypothetical protein